MIALKGGDLAVLRILRDGTDRPKKEVARYLKRPEALAETIDDGLARYDREKGTYSITVAGLARLRSIEPDAPEVLPPPHLGVALQWLAANKPLTAPWAETGQFFGVADTRRKVTRLGLATLELYSMHGVSALALVWLRALAKLGGSSTMEALASSVGVTPLVAMHGMDWLGMTGLVKVTWPRDQVALAARGRALLDKAFPVAQDAGWFA